MKTVTVEELGNLLYNQVGATFVTILAYTEPDTVGGKACPVKGVRKLALVNGVINWSYENAVNKQRLREGQPADENGAVEYFEPAARRWGTRLHKKIGEKTLLTPLVEHKGERHSLELKVERSLRYNYYLDGKHIAKDKVEPHLRPRSEGKRQQVENPVILRDYKLCNVKAIRFNGEAYVVV